MFGYVAVNYISKDIKENYIGIILTIDSVRYCINVRFCSNRNFYHKKKNNNNNNNNKKKKKKKKHLSHERKYLNLLN